MSETEKGPFPEEMAVMLTEVVSNWRIQENILSAAYTLYIYYYLTTVDEEVEKFWKSKLRLGKLLFLTLRYATLVLIVVYLMRDFRSYLTISPKSCKLLLIIGEDTFKGVTLVLSDVAFGLCLCALLGAKPIAVLIIMVLYIAFPDLVLKSLPVVTFVFHLIGNSQLPALPLDPLSEELGYPCYLNSNEDFVNTTAGLGRNTRAYVNFGRTTLLMLLAIATIVARYRKHSGRLIHVIRRDGGLYYLTVAATRLAAAVVTTPTVVPVEKLSENPSVVLVAALQEIIVPLLAQRLLLNIRSIDNMGSTPLASTLLFSPAKGGSEDLGSREDMTESYDMPESVRPTGVSSRREEKMKEEPNA